MSFASFIAFIVIYTLFCSLEIVVFNEEILLALCFFSFVFFAYNTLADTVTNIFNERAKKFESEFLISFDLKKNLIMTNFNSNCQNQSVVHSIKCLLIASVINMQLTNKLIVKNMITSVKTTNSLKLAEFSLLNNKILNEYKFNCISKILYPLIFKTSTASINIKKISVVSLKNTNSKTIKILCIK